MSVRIRPQARIDILELSERFWDQYPGVALAFHARLDESIALLERFPSIGAEAPFPIPANPAIRFFPIKKFQSFLIVYLPLSSGVDIIRVLDGRRDLGSILLDE
jgi:plasmid stabilization system protein ParE